MPIKSKFKNQKSKIFHPSCNFYSGWGVLLSNESKKNMRTIITLALMLGLLFPALAQVGKGDTTKLKMGDRKVWIFRDKKKIGLPGRLPSNFVWMGIDVGINGWATPGFKSQIQGDYSFMELDYGRSWKFAWNLFEVKAPLNKKKTATFVTGVGFEWNSYSFKQKIALREANDYGPVNPGDYVFVNAADPTVTYKRTRLQNSWFNIPILFNFRTIRTPEHKQQFNFTFGVVGGVRMGASQREVFIDDGNKARNIRRDDFMLERFRATATLRMRYSYFSVFGTYTFTPMFQKGAPLVYPWSAGIAFHPF